MSLMPVDEAKALVLAGVKPKGIEKVALNEALGRVLAVDLHARHHQPPFTASAMDGYAAIFGTSTTNFLTFVTTDNGPLELLKKAIEMHHSVDPDAIKNALTRAGETLKAIDWFQVTETRGVVNDGVITFQVTLRVGFRLLSDSELRDA